MKLIKKKHFQTLSKKYALNQWWFPVIQNVGIHVNSGMMSFLTQTQNSSNQSINACPEKQKIYILLYSAAQVVGSE